MGWLWEYTAPWSPPGYVWVGSWFWATEHCDAGESEELASTWSLSYLDPEADE
jgi:hypothetical protein